MIQSARDIHHFVVNNGQVREFSAEEGAQVAIGKRLLPEYAGDRIRYVQVVMKASPDEEEVQVQIAGAVLQFDPQGKLAEAAARPEGDFGEFEQETCVQLALRSRVIQNTVVH